MKKQANKTNELDVSKLRIVDEPYKSSRPVVVSKYEHIFSALELGPRIVCPPESAASIAATLRKWLLNRGRKDFAIRQCSRCADGKGGVWLLEKQENTQNPKKPQKPKRGKNA
jgi:hypothetical protein